MPHAAKQTVKDTVPSSRCLLCDVCGSSTSIVLTGLNFTLTSVSSRGWGISRSWSANPPTISSHDMLHLRRGWAPYEGDK